MRQERAPRVFDVAAIRKIFTSFPNELDINFALLAALSACYDRGNVGDPHSFTISIAKRSGQP